MRLLLSLLFTTVLCTGARAQTWTDFDLSATSGDQRITPRQARTLTVAPEELHDLLFAAPHEKNVVAETSEAILTLPLPGGGTADFRIVGYDISGEEALEKYPDIRTWYGINVADPTQSIFLDWTSRGFHASVRGGNSVSFFIDPVYRGDLEHYQVYRKSDLDPTEEPFTCDTEHDERGEDLPTGGTALLLGDCELMEYRLTITTTGEYSNYHGATSVAQSDLVQSAVVTTINRINQVTSRNLSLRMELVGNNDLLYNYDPDNDPFPTNAVGSLIGENTPYTTGIIGEDNYDFGNIFSQGGGGGIASLRASCVDSRKAAGATSLGSPEGDFFDVDYVAHEMGHNFGGNHTQNNNCNYSSSAGMEPGSGSTVMSYAGICNPNVQNQVDDYYHGRSIEEMTTHFEFGNGGCGTIINTSLNNATITSPLDHTIPAGTPFKLTSGATGNGTINYNWEQYDVERGATMPPVGTNVEGPLFRSLPAVAEPERFFPRLPDVIAGTSGTWEELPTVSREMNFRATVLNYNAAYGCAVEDDLTLQVDASDDPFTVTDPLNGTQWNTGQVAEIRWDVASTDRGDINSRLTDVLLSTDGGVTFEILLEATPNDGYAEVIVPDNTGSQNRVMVRSNDNIFYNVSTADFSIVTGPGTPSVALNNISQPGALICFSETVSPVFSFVTTSGSGATAPISWSVTGLPAGVTATFTTSPNAPGDAFDLELENLVDLPVGVTTLTLTGVSADGTFTETFAIEKNGDVSVAAPTNLTPTATEIDLRPVLTANQQGGAVYDIEVSAFSDFSTLLYSATGLTNPEFTVPDYLTGNTTYYWRIRALDEQNQDECNTSEWTEASFTTDNCLLFASDAEAQPISSGAPPITAEMDLLIMQTGTIKDLDVYQLDISHTFLGDINVDLEHPDGTLVNLWDQSCGGNNNIFASFDDESSANAPCPPVDGGFYAPPAASPLSALDEKPLPGTWTMRVTDNADQDGGSLNGFTLKVCLDEAQTLPVEWLSFTAVGKKEYILLDWATGEEIANRGFTIERSLTGQQNWTELGFVAAGADYTFPDRTALPQTDYVYRLRQEDLDGRVSYSEIRTARYGAGQTGLTVFPNPTGDRLNYRISGTREFSAYSLLDVNGRVLKTGLLNTDAGMIDLGDYPSGVYLLRTEVEVLRVVKR